MKQQDAIIDQAESEASAIMEQADRETVSETAYQSGCEKRDVRTGTCNDRAVCRSCGSTACEALLEEALKEMGEHG